MTLREVLEQLERDGATPRFVMDKFTLAIFDPNGVERFPRPTAEDYAWLGRWMVQRGLDFDLETARWAVN